MSHKANFILSHYGVMLLCVMSFWGTGKWVLDRTNSQLLLNVWLREGLAISLGLGVFILGLQVLGMVELLKRSAIITLLLGGWILAALYCWKRPFRPLGPMVSERPDPPDTPHGWMWGLAVWVALTASLLPPLLPPTAFDALMYHLPLAREWAQQGNIAASEWLRYPWFPYNFDLLFSAALLLRDDVFTQMFHALAGWLVAMLIYGVGRTWLGRPAAALAAVLWLHLTHPDYGTAYIDMGLTLYVFAGAVSFWVFWTQHDLRWLLISAFLSGTAIGIKLQSLFFMLAPMLICLWRERRPMALAKSAALLLVPCAYWYARAWWHTGDPIHPLGGPIFGFTDWAAEDLRMQFDDLRAVAAWPSPWIVAALLPATIPVLRRNATVQALILWTVPAATLWLLTSSYPRYLLPAYPIALLLTATAIQWALLHMLRSVQTIGSKVDLQALGLVLGATLITTAYHTSIHPQLSYLYQHLPTTAVQRVGYLNDRVACFGLLSALRENHSDDRIFQLYLSGSQYYGPHPMWGDALGPWAYRHYMALSAKDMANRLSTEGFSILAVNSNYVQVVEGMPGFGRHFSLLTDQMGCRAYRVSAPFPSVQTS